MSNKEYGGEKSSTRKGAFGTVVHSSTGTQVTAVSSGHDVTNRNQGILAWKATIFVPFFFTNSISIDV